MGGRDGRGGKGSSAIPWFSGSLFRQVGSREYLRGEWKGRGGRSSRIVERILWEGERVFFAVLTMSREDLREPLYSKQKELKNYFTGVEQRGCNGGQHGGYSYSELSLPRSSMLLTT